MKTGGLQGASHGIDATGEGERERSDTGRAAQFQFVFAELVIVDDEIHAGRVNHDITLLITSVRARAESRVPGGLFATQWFAVLQDDYL